LRKGEYYESSTLRSTLNVASFLTFLSVFRLYGTNLAHNISLTVFVLGFSFALEFFIPSLRLPGCEHGIFSFFCFLEGIGGLALFACIDGYQLAWRFLFWSRGIRSECLVRHALLRARLLF
jgi:hypothetical protein